MSNTRIIALAVAFASALTAAGLAAWPVRSASVPGSLIKTACPNGAASTHPCKAVYFHGSDGKRHAFPNEKVYFSWYQDFSSVKTVTASEMAALPLGRNVTYRPGSKPVKFQTDLKTYAVALGGELRWIVSEDAAKAVYGADWASLVDDIPDAFFVDYRFGAPIGAAADYSPSTETSYAVTIDDDLPATLRQITVTTAIGSFRTDVVKLQRARFRMATDVAAASDCKDDCPAEPLAVYAQAHGASIGMHGTYFCPPDYADCAGKVNTFLSPVFDTASRTMLNASSLQVHKGPMLTGSSDGQYRLFHRTSEFGSVASFEGEYGTTLEGAISNYPSLLEGGVRVVESESRLDEGMKTIKGTRGGIGFDDRFVYLVITRSATVPDLADVFQAINATDAMNLDGGGTAAMLYDGKYVVGPGRELPNAILFVAR